MKKGSKIILTIIILFILCCAAFFLWTKNVGQNEEKTVEEVLSVFSFEGKLYNTVIFDDKYANLIYENNHKLVSHYISIDNQEEISINELIKKDFHEDFENIVKELLLKKYPSKIVDILLSNVEYQYIFRKDFLELVFYDNEKVLDTNRDFNLKINYKYIKDYVVFNLTDYLDFEDEDGYTYDSKKVSMVFTFDDGPNGQKTEEIISLLEDYKMSATFFIVGNKIVNGADTIKLINSSHSEIGYHSFNHSYFTKQTTSQIQEEYNLSKDLLKEYASCEFKYVRAPYGSFNESVLNSLDLPFIQWNVDTNDWRYKDPEYTKNHVLTHIKDGNIILFHDSYQTTIEAIRLLIHELYLKDIQIMNISSLANLKNISMQMHTVYYGL